MKNIPHKIVDHIGIEWEFSRFIPFSDGKLQYHFHGRNRIDVTPRMIETNFLRNGRPEPTTNIIVQGKYECAAASLAMLLGEKLFYVKRAMGKHQWRNDDRGASDDIIINAARDFGRDLIYLKRSEISKKIGSCIITAYSLNIKNMCHALAWNGKEMLDPNWGKAGRIFWGCEWAPWTIDARNALVLLDRELSNAERKELDEAIRRNEEKAIEAIKSQLLKELKEAS